jgi:hypothetical protein
MTAGVIRKAPLLFSAHRLHPAPTREQRAAISCYIPDARCAPGPVASASPLPSEEFTDLLCIGAIWQ